MKLKDYRNSDSEYNIGIDAGTGSCGWAVVDDETGDLCYFKRKPTWGSRIYSSAETAATARAPRSQRRRLSRRRQRLNLLQEIFYEEISRVDPEFFIRLKRSYEVAEDRDFNHPIFNATDFAEAEYYHRFPTIYHLRKFLMETDEKQDIRLVYLALHNIVKCRGNFLYEDTPDLSAENANAKIALEKFVLAANDYYEQKGIESFSFEIDLDSCEDLIGNTTVKRADKKEELTKLFAGLSSVDKKLPEYYAKAVLGYSVDFNKIFDDEDSETAKFALDNEEKVEEYKEKLDDGLALFESLQAVYSSTILMNILQGEKSISSAKVKSYDDYKNDLILLKKLVKKYNPAEYARFFRGSLYADGSGYDPSKAQGYTLYNLIRKPKIRENFTNDVRKILKSAQDVCDPDYLKLTGRIEEDTFLKRQKTGESGAIPFQLHLEEMNAIIDKQGKFYGFLKEEKEKLNSLVTFRIPYYVGPLTTKNASKDAFGNNRFAWSERLEGKENEKIFPWNWEEIIDKDKSAEAFMKRMIGTCTYIYGEPVLPKCSLYYEFFCVLNELNGAKWSEGDGESQRFDTNFRQGIVKELFMTKKNISYDRVKKWLVNQGCLAGIVKVSGGQGESGFVSKLNSWNDFCDILGVKVLSDSQFEMAENIILWKSLYQDKDILKRKIKNAYADQLDAGQIKKILNKNYSGWGRLSKKLLLELKASTDNGPKSIMDILWEGNQNNGNLPIGASQIFMEIYHDDDYGFEDIVEEINETNIERLSIQSLPGSPALKRTVNQSLRIVDEIVRLTGKPPKNIFIEYTRDDDENKKGKRTDTRYKHLENALKVFKDENKDVWEEFKNKSNDDLTDDRLMLYFLQRGKCMYSGKELDINNLSSYQVDHIIPQCYVKDDSLDNKVLVYAEENQRKLDNLLLEPRIKSKMHSFWRECYDMSHNDSERLISEKKYRNLKRSDISDNAMKGFIARQLVETNQIVNFMKDLLAQEYPETNVRFVKASVTSGLREKCAFVKCREINDFHHAHDAYLACKVGMFINKRHPVAYENPIAMAKAVKDYVKGSADGYKKSGRIPGSGGFFVSSFLRSGFDKETGEIFKDDWDAEKEIGRIRKVLDYKQVYISRMVEETTGKFWKETVYSPRDKKMNLTLGVKNNLEPKKYGGFSCEQFAYFFIYEIINEKGSKELRFGSVPVSVASDVSSKGIQGLIKYAENLAGNECVQFSRIVRDKIFKKQLISNGRDILSITGNEEVRNSRQLAFSQTETLAFSKIIEGKEIEENSIVRLVKNIISRSIRIAPTLSNKISLSSIDLSDWQGDLEKLKEFSQNLVKIINGNDRKIDMEIFNGSKNAGQFKINFNKELNSTDLYLIDQSVTGMLERKTRIKNL